MSTTNFSREELECKCGQCGGEEPTEEFQDQLEVLRYFYGRPMPINSGRRCIFHPIEAKKMHAGPHTIGAVDVRVHTGDAVALIKAALELEWTGFGISQKGDLNLRYIHLDRCESKVYRIRPAIWSY